MTARTLATFLVVLIVLGGFGVPAAADQNRTLARGSGLMLPELTHDEAQELRRRGVEINPVLVQTRPAALAPLYLTLAALNAGDAYSTYAAISNGAREVNPFMQAAAERPGVMFAAKAVATAGTIYAAERMWKNGNRAGAIVTMVAVNGAMAAVMAHNLRNARR